MWAILLYLEFHADADNVCTTTKKEIAEALSLTSKTVQNMLPELESKGLIRISRGSRSNEKRFYVVNRNVLWKSIRDEGFGQLHGTLPFIRILFYKEAYNYWMYFAKDNGTTFSVLIYLVLKSDKENYTDVSIQQIADDLGLGKRTIDRDIACLVRNDIVSRTVKDGQLGIAVNHQLFWASGREDLWQSLYNGKTNPLTVKQKGEW